MKRNRQKETATLAVKSVLAFFASSTATMLGISATEAIMQ
jgi:hypothetical protein